MVILPICRPESIPNAAQSNDLGKTKGKRYGMVY